MPIGAFKNVVNGTLLADGTIPLTANWDVGNFDITAQGLSLSGRLTYDALPDADHTATGHSTDTLAAGATIAAFELCYLHTDGEWALTDADALATAGPVMLGLALEAKTDGVAMDTALPGSFVRDDTWAWTIGAELYVSTTPGAMTETAPVGASDIVRVVGYAVSADVIYFNPSADWTVV